MSVPNVPANAGSARSRHAEPLSQGPCVGGSRFLVARHANLLSRATADRVAERDGRFGRTDEFLDVVDLTGAVEPDDMNTFQLLAVGVGAELEHRVSAV